LTFAPVDIEGTAALTADVPLKLPPRCHDNSDQQGEPLASSEKDHQ